MTPPFPLTTERLVLRGWRESDRDSFAVLNADRATMALLPGPLSRAESDALFDRINTHWETYGFGLCAVEHRGVGECIGFIGLAVPQFDAPFMPVVEIGWRLTARWWGRGFATEGAREMVRYAFDLLALEQLVSFTVPANVRSRRVMEKLGMNHDRAGDFDHPNLPPGHPLRRHVLYRLRRQDWTEQ